MVDLRIELPEHFLDSEERCGYLVSEQMKRIWAVQLDLMHELLRVCAKHGIKIFGSDGTMLGAVRHRGFIPWDDDMDFSILREDYIRLCAVAEAEFKHPYFFQTEYSDPGCLRGHAQLRNTETTAIIQKERRMCTFNQGIFIDIFPLDRAPDDEALLARQKETVRGLRKQAFKYAKLSTRYYSHGGRLGRVKRAAAHLIGGGYFRRMELKKYAEMEAACRMYNAQDTEYRFRPGFFVDLPKLRADSLEKIITVPFEFLEIPIPADYDTILRTIYGDYMVMKPGGGLHGEILFDTDRSYREYLREGRA